MKTKTLSIQQIGMIAILAVFSAYLILVVPKTLGTSSANTLVFEGSAVTVKPITKAVDVPKIAPQTTAVPLPIVPSNILNRIAPVYPTAAVRNGVEGLVTVKALIGMNGELKKSVIKSSSGSADLDKAAISSLNSWKFSSAKMGVNSVDSWLEIPFRFALK